MYKKLSWGFDFSFVIVMQGNHARDAHKAGSDPEAASFVKGEAGDLFLLVGTYTSEKGSKGIYLYRFNALTGDLIQ